jgi:acetyl-CoA carboxylase carboxyltransferase component
MTMREIEDLRQRIEQGGGTDKTDEQRRQGKLTARERLNLLLDDRSFLETDAFAGGAETPCEGVVTGFGTVEGRPVYAYAQDFTVLGGSLGRAHAQKICKVMDLAYKTGVPIVALLDSAGARLREGLDAVAGYGEVYRRIARYSGAVPQVGVVCGPCVGGAAWAAALMDFVFLSGKGAKLQTWGPQVTQAAGIADVPADANDCAQFSFDTERECLDRARELLSLLPANGMEDPPAASGPFDLNSAVPELNDLTPGCYDMHVVISVISDNGYFFSTSNSFAPNVLTGFIRVNGRTAGIVANQPAAKDGIMDCAACEKAARFIRFCDAFNIPVLSLVDTKGPALDAAEEKAGLALRCAELARAYALASVPLVTVVCGRAHGGTFAAMGGRALGIDAVFAWPHAEISVSPPETAVNILCAGEIAAAEDPNQAREELVLRYRSKDSSPLVAAAGGHVDDVIEPSATRTHVAAALEMLLGKRGGAFPSSMKWERGPGG